MKRARNRNGGRSKLKSTTATSGAKQYLAIVQDRPKPTKAALKRLKAKRVFIRSQRPAPVVKANPILIQRLKELMTEYGLSGSTLAQMAGTGYTAIYDILSEKSKNPLPEALQSIAQVLKVDVAYLIGASDDRVLPTESPRLAVPILGVAETGVYRIMVSVQTSRMHALRKIDAPPHPHYPHLQHFALEIGADDSMNAAKPVPLLRGMVALCVDVTAVASAPIETGRLYAVRIANPNGELHETVIRRVVLHPGGYELLAESTQKEFEALFFPGQPTTNPSESVSIFGLIYGLEFVFS